jgi:hypothetical protein
MARRILTGALVLVLLSRFNDFQSYVKAFQSKSLSLRQRTYFGSSPPPSKWSSALNAQGNDFEKPLLTTGVLASKFSDGIVSNPDVKDFLMRGLVKSWLAEKQTKAENVIKESVIVSPCNGPDVSALSSLELADERLATLQKDPSQWSDIAQALWMEDEKELELRFVYIPTALYALRADSENTPGKQRQRARADGKQRRNAIVDLLKEQLNDTISILAVTLDFDDGSVKQPEGSDDKRRFPKVSDWMTRAALQLPNGFIDY